jgi:GNAT superfamily N-acetyltransferase
MRMIRVRDAIVDDLPLIVELIHGLAEHARMSAVCTATEDQLRLHLFGPRPYCEIVIGEDGRGPAGFALFFTTYSTFLAKPGLYLEDLFVLPDRRGCGLGTALFQHVAKLAVTRDCGRLEWSVLDWDEPALQFYKKLGAEMLTESTTCRLAGAALNAVAHQRS